MGEVSSEAPVARFGRALPRIVKSFVQAGFVAAHLLVNLDAARVRFGFLLPWSQEGMVDRA